MLCVMLCAACTMYLLSAKKVYLLSTLWVVLAHALKWEKFCSLPWLYLNTFMCILERDLKYDSNDSILHRWLRRNIWLCAETQLAEFFWVAVFQCYPSESFPWNRVEGLTKRYQNHVVHFSYDWRKLHVPTAFKPTLILRKQIWELWTSTLA